MSRRYVIKGGPDEGLPGDISEMLPNRVIVQYRAFITLNVDTRSGYVTRVTLDGELEDPEVFDRETWQQLDNDEDVKYFIEHFDPRHAVSRENLGCVWHRHKEQKP